MKIVKSSLIISALLLSACQQAMGMEAVATSPVDSHDNTVTTDQYGEADHIESVLVVYPPAWPEEIQVVVNGVLPDGCTKIYMIKPVRYENIYTIMIYTIKEVGVECTLALVPFEETITLDTSELSSGNYSVDVYGISTSFALEIPADSNDGGG